MRDHLEPRVNKQSTLVAIIATLLIFRLMGLTVDYTLALLLYKLAIHTLSCQQARRGHKGVATSHGLTPFPVLRHTAVPYSVGDDVCSWVVLAGT